MILQNDFLGGLILTGAFALFVVLAELWIRFAKPDPELPRKFIHLLGGIACLAFPFLVQKPLSVLIIAVIFSGTFFISGKLGKLKSLHGVARKSYGSEYYPFTVAALFYICQGKLWLYVASILIMTMADAAASIVGGNYGKIKYMVDENDQKSLEGSIIFFLLTVQIIQVPLLLMTDIPAPVVVLAAFMVAVLLTGVEAISCRGSDNIFVPILACYILMKITTKPIPEVAFQCASLVVISTTLIIVNRIRRVFRTRDSILFILFCYATWSLCSIAWTVPLFIAYIVYQACNLVIKNTKDYEIANGALSRSLYTPLLLVFVANYTDEYDLLFGPYVVAIILTASNGFLNYFINHIEDRKISRKILVPLLASIYSIPILAATCFFTYWLNYFALFIYFVISVVFTVIFSIYLGKPKGIPLAPRQVHMVWILSSLAASIVLFLQITKIIQVW